MTESNSIIETTSNGTAKITRPSSDVDNAVVEAVLDIETTTLPEAVYER